MKNAIHTKLWSPFDVSEMDPADKAESARRLLVLAKFLEQKVPRKMFDYTVIMEGNTEEPLNPNHCGSVGCAIGWMPSIPLFKKMGAAPDEGGIRDRDGNHDFSAAAYMCLMTRDEASSLFSPWVGGAIGLAPLTGSATPKQVAKKIRQFVKLYRAPEVKS